MLWLKQCLVSYTNLLSSLWLQTVRKSIFKYATGALLFPDACSTAASCCFITCQCAEQRALCQRIFFRINKSCTVYTWRFHRGPQTSVSSFFCSSCSLDLPQNLFLCVQVSQRQKNKDYSQLELNNYICNSDISAHINLLQVCWCHFVSAWTLEWINTDLDTCSCYIPAHRSQHWFISAILACILHILVVLSGIP